MLPPSFPSSLPPSLISYFPPALLSSLPLLFLLFFLPSLPLPLTPSLPPSLFSFFPPFLSPSLPPSLPHSLPPSLSPSLSPSLTPSLPPSPSQFYRKPLLALTTTSQPILTERDINTVFYRTEDFADLHTSLHEKLEPQLRDWSVNTCVGDFFVDLVREEGGRGECGSK